MTERGRPALAKAVHVHDGDEIVQAVNARERGRFPDRAPAISPSPSST